MTRLVLRSGEGGGRKILRSIQTKRSANFAAFRAPSHWPIWCTLVQQWRRRNTSSVVFYRPTSLTILRTILCLAWVHTDIWLQSGKVSAKYFNKNHIYGLFRASAVMQMRSEVFSDVTQWSKTDWPIKMEPTVCPETPVQNYHSTQLNIPHDRRSKA